MGPIRQSATCRMGPLFKFLNLYLIDSAVSLCLHCFREHSLIHLPIKKKKKTFTDSHGYMTKKAYEQFMVFIFVFKTFVTGDKVHV